MITLIKRNHLLTPYHILQLHAINLKPLGVHFIRIDDSKTSRDRFQIGKFAFNRRDFAAAGRFTRWTRRAGQGKAGAHQEWN